jgi:hypothetical protein
MVALVLLFTALVLCWGVCSWKVFKIELVDHDDNVRESGISRAR